MIEKVINIRNLQRAYYQVYSNQGSAGVDGMSVTALSKHLQLNRKRILTAIVKGEYQPQFILGVSIPKSNGKARLLGIPTVTDRWLQQAVHQVIMPQFEREFKENSYGFRPNRNAQQAVKQSLKNINEGYKHIVDIDLQNFFDEVDHCIILQLLYRKVKCSLTLRLIRKWLTAPILINGKLTKRRKGVPQGSPLSPLLSNIMLHELDTELEKKGHRYVRYADDFSIYTKTKTAAEKVNKYINKFLKDKLKLIVNQDKSGIRKPTQFEILGYTFTSTFNKGDKDKYQLIASKKSWTRLKMNLKMITRKTTPSSLNERIFKLREVQRGWLQYFRIGSILGKLKDLDGWGATGCGTASGQIGRNQIGKERILFVWE